MQLAIIASIRLVALGLELEAMISSESKSAWIASIFAVWALRMRFPVYLMSRVSMPWASRSVISASSKFGRIGLDMGLRPEPLGESRPCPREVPRGSIAVGFADSRYNDEQADVLRKNSFPVLPKGDLVGLEEISGLFDPGLRLHIANSAAPRGRR